MAKEEEYPNQLFNKLYDAYYTKIQKEAHVSSPDVLNVSAFMGGLSDMSLVSDAVSKENADKGTQFIIDESKGDPSGRRIAVSSHPVVMAIIQMISASYICKGQLERGRYPANPTHDLIIAAGLNELKTLGALHKLDTLDNSTKTLLLKVKEGLVARGGMRVYSKRGTMRSKKHKRSKKTKTRRSRK